MRILQFFAVVLVCVTGGGCASIVSHSSWPVAVNSSPSGIPVTVKDEHGATVHQAPTPFTVVLKSSDGFFDAADYILESKYGATTLSAGLNPWYAGNIIFGGLIGLLIVDPATGAMWKLRDVVYVPGAPTEVAATSSPTPTQHRDPARPTVIQSHLTLPRRTAGPPAGLGTAQIAKRSLPAVLEVVCGDVSGSAFSISPDGYILTNHHVVEEGRNVRVVLPSGAEFSATIVAQAPRADVALLKVEGNNLPFLYLAHPGEVEIGQDVLVIGAPLGFTGSVTRGIVSAIRQWDEVSVIQIDAPVNFGNSGGPVLDIFGNVIGIASMGVDKEKGEGLGFAVSVETILESVGLILEDEEIEAR